METKPFENVSSSPSDCNDRRSEKTSSEADQRRPDQRSDQRRRTSQVISSGRRNFRVIVSVIVNELSNKQLHLIRNPFICHGTPDTWQYFLLKCRYLPQYTASYPRRIHSSLFLYCFIRARNLSRSGKNSLKTKSWGGIWQRSNKRGKSTLRGTS
jgi:hypothetical protein